MLVKNIKMLNKALYVCFTLSSIVLSEDGYAAGNSTSRLPRDDSNNRGTLVRRSTANYNSFDTPEEKVAKDAAYANYCLAEEAWRKFVSEASRGIYSSFDQEAIKRHNLAIDADLEASEAAEKYEEIVNRAHDEQLKRTR